jgi:hypothetical protein
LELSFLVQMSKILFFPPHPLKYLLKVSFIMLCFQLFSIKSVSYEHCFRSDLQLVHGISGIGSQRN